MDEMSPPASPPPVAAEPPVTAALVVYALYTLAGVVALATAGTHAAPLLSTVGVVGLIIAYVKRGDARGTWVASHFTYLIRTFWWALAASAVGVLFFITFLGIPIALAIWFFTGIWILYRIIRGYLYFKDSRPLPMN
ncbi:MAG: hypothetical protein JSR18_10815 [Proteobacteria bacterium]|nr:hypothetical protein [Pseudomonadota bacterium]